MADPKFWMVIGKGGEVLQRHESLETAEDTAGTLARNNPGWDFLVLEAVAAFTVTPQPVTKQVFKPRASGL